MKILKIVLKIVGACFAVVGFFSLILLLGGYRPILDLNATADWNAIGSGAECISALAAVAIPFVVVWFERKYNRDKADIGISNAELLEKFLDLQQLVMKNPTAEDETPGNPDALKEKQKKDALLYINIRMYANTADVAKHLNISDEGAFRLLEEMLRHDKSISAGGRIYISRMNEIVWMKKAKR